MGEQLGTEGREDRYSGNRVQVQGGIFWNNTTRSENHRPNTTKCPGHGKSQHCLINSVTIRITSSHPTNYTSCPPREAVPLRGCRELKMKQTTLRRSWVTNRNSNRSHHSQIAILRISKIEVLARATHYSNSLQVVVEHFKRIQSQSFAVSNSSSNSSRTSCS